jgi:hypothetical protein
VYCVRFRHPKCACSANFACRYLWTCARLLKKGSSRCRRNYWQNYRGEKNRDCSSCNLVPIANATGTNSVHGEPAILLCSMRDGTGIVHCTSQYALFHISCSCNSQFSAVCRRRVTSAGLSETYMCLGAYIEDTCLRTNVHYYHGLCRQLNSYRHSLEMCSSPFYAETCCDAERTALDLCIFHWNRMPDAIWVYTWSTHCYRTHDSCIFYCWIGNVVVHNELQIFFKLVLSMRCFCNHSSNLPVAGTPANGSVYLLKHFRIHIYLNYFHCFEP